MAKGLQSLKYSFTVPEKPKYWTMTQMFNIHSVAKQKLKGEFFSEKKSDNAEKNQKGDPLASPGILVQFVRADGSI